MNDHILIMVKNKYPDIHKRLLSYNRIDVSLENAGDYIITCFNKSDDEVLSMAYNSSVDVLRYKSIR